LIDNAHTRAVPADRVHWLDRSKGAGILLVVLGHALLGTQAAGLMPADDTFRALIKGIYNFHMPLFFLLSGITFEVSARRHSVVRTARDRTVRLLWPFLLWTYVFLGLQLLAGDAVNSADDLSAGSLIWPLPPREHLWFLWALFIIQMVTVPIAAPGRTPRPTRLWLVLALTAIVLVAVPGLPLGPLTVDAALHLGIFWLGVWLARLGPLPSGGVVALLALAIFAGVQAASFHLPVTIITIQVIATLLSLSFIVMMNAPHGEGAAPWRMLAWLGRLSLPIYLAHTVFSAATRIFLMPLTENPVVHLTLGTLAGVIGPILLYHGLRRVGATRLAGF